MTLSPRSHSTVDCRCLTQLPTSDTSTLQYSPCSR